MNFFLDFFRVFFSNLFVALMVVISAAIVTRSRTLFARQYLEVSRLQIEGLLSMFAKRVGEASAVSRQDHTFIETESVRFVYQPMESGLFLVLTTTKDSNMLENLDTLRLLSKLLQEICHANPAPSSTQSSITNEEAVLLNAFDLVFAFDEAISFGYREPVTASQINQYVEMESHEERLHQMIQQSKENEAKETAKRKQQELSELRKKQLRDEKLLMNENSSSAPVPSYSSGGVPSSAFETSMDSPVGAVASADAARRHEDLLARQAALVAASQKSASVPAPQWNPSMNAEAVDYTSTSTSAPRKGMALGATSRNRSSNQ